MNFREHVSCGRWKCMAVGGGRHGEPRTGVRGCGALFGVRGARNAAVKLEFLRVLCLRRDVQTLVNGLVF